MHTIRISLAAILSLGLVASCDDSAEQPMTIASCDQETRAEAYVAGMSRTGANGLEVILVESTPTPPRKGNNDWRVRILDASGNPLSGLTLDVVPEMPDHGHDSIIYPTATEVEGQAGEYLLVPVRLWMPGYWEVNVAIDDGAGLTDSAQFKLCIEG